MRRAILALLLAPILTLSACIEDGKRERVGIDHSFYDYPPISEDAGFENNYRDANIFLVQEKDVQPLEDIIDRDEEEHEIANFCGTNIDEVSAREISIPAHTVTDIYVQPLELIRLRVNHFAQAYIHWPEWKLDGYFSFKHMDEREAYLGGYLYKPDRILWSMDIPLVNRWSDLSLDGDTESELKIKYSKFEPYPNGEANPDDGDDFGTGIFYFGICNP